MSILGILLPGEVIREGFPEEERCKIKGEEESWCMDVGVSSPLEGLTYKKILRGDSMLGGIKSRYSCSREQRGKIMNIRMMMKRVVVTATIKKLLQCSGYCSKCFVHTNLFNPHDSLLKYVLLLKTEEQRS